LSDVNQEESTMSNSFDALCRDIETCRSDMIELQRGLTARPAIAPESGGTGEHEKSLYLEERVRALGFSLVERFTAPDARLPGTGRPSLMVTVPGRDRGRALWIMTHIDIVPPGDLAAWQGDPYALREENGRLYGRGTEDNQQSLVASLYACLAVKQAGLVPPADVNLLFVADEETGSAYGIKYLLDSRPELFKKPALALVPDAGAPDGSTVEIAEKSLLWLKFSTKGLQVHGSTPHLGRNAFLAASDMVMRLAELNRLYARRDELFDPPVSTFSPTKKEANVPNINTIPGEDVFYFDCRILPQEDVEEVLGRMRAIARDIEKKYGVTVEMSPMQRESSPATPPDSALVTRLAAAIKRVYGVTARPVGIGGGTVGAFMRRAGIDTAVWSRIEHTAHMPNEHCLVDNMVGDAKVMAALMLEGDR
jgi:succinyl-diaminopimelate desuccinylase